MGGYLWEIKGIMNSENVVNVKKMFFMKCFGEIVL